jgi:hypothetical protein
MEKKRKYGSIKYIIQHVYSSGLQVRFKTWLTYNEVLEPNKKDNK